MNSVLDNSQSSFTSDFRAKWKCPVHANEGVALDIIGFCYVHDTYICQECSYDHMMCEPRVLLIDLQKKIILHGKELKEQVTNVKKGYESRLVKVTEMRAFTKKKMAERINFFNTLVEEIKQAMQEHSDYVEAELDEAVEKISYFPALCEQNLNILDILGKKCDLRKIDPDIFKRFCTSFDQELGQMQVPIERLESETTQIKMSSAQFANYVSEIGMPIRAIRDQIVYSSKLQNRHLVESILRKKVAEKGGNLTEGECRKVFEDFIQGLKLYSAPSKDKIEEAFKSYDFLEPNDVSENIAVDAVMQSIQELQKEVRAVTQNEIAQSQVFLPA
jgi:polyhydroxyalkanoate synthesis regulator phasin